MGGLNNFFPAVQDQYLPKPENALDNLAKAAGIKQQQQQTEQSAALAPSILTQNQNAAAEGTRQRKDNEAADAAIKEWDPTKPDDLPGLLSKHGASYGAVIGARKTLLDNQVAMTKLQTDQLANKKSQNDMLAGQIDALGDVADKDLPSAIQQIQAPDPVHQQRLQQYATMAATDPTSVRGYLAHDKKSLMGESALADAAIKDRNATSEETKASAAMITATTGNPEKQAENAWLLQHPGKNAYDYKLQSKIDEQNAALPGEIAKARAMGTAGAQAGGKDYEAMIRTGVNPISKEKLTLDNAPESMLVDSQGNPVPLAQQSLYKPTSQEKQTADTARQVLQIADKLQAEVQKNPNLIGPLMGRDQKALSALGYNSQQSQEMLDDVSLLQSAATKMHTGRFSNEILNKMSGMLDAHMDSPAFQGGLNSIKDVAGRYAKEDSLITVGEQKQLKEAAKAAPAGGGGKLPQGNGQPIDKATAQQFYQAAGGDPAKARQLAAQSGWKVQ